MEAPALSFQGVHKSYLRSHLGRTAVSRGIEALDLELRPGEIFGLLGLNGSGKTTAFKLALGLLRPTRGRIEVFGLPAGSIEARAGIGYLPELPCFYPSLTPREVLGFYGRLSGLPATSLPSRVDAVLEKVGLGAQAGRPLEEFSKGMLQRAALAQAVLHDPRLLILDEPVGGLDPLAIAEFRRLFLDLNREGKTLILSSHSISEVERLCHRAGILVEGRLVRVLKQEEWSQAAGALEEFFIAAVGQGR